MVQIFVKRCAGIILAAILALSFSGAASAVVTAETSSRAASDSAAASTVTDPTTTDSAVTDSEMRPSELYARYAVLMDAATGFS